MTESLKWVVTGVAGLILVGGIIGAHEMRNNAVASADPTILKEGTGVYPVPEVSIASQVLRPIDAQNISRSSSLYGDSSTRKRRSRKKKSQRTSTKVLATTTTKASSTDADPEMGYMAADDKKLQEAMKKAERADRSGDGHSEPEGR